MAKLFAALNSDGEVRFVDEVPRGTACACRCPECVSPLVAKQGEARAWHFAHEAGQERPECEAGAANLLRRVAIELLRNVDPLDPPPYVQHLQAHGGGQVWKETVELSSARIAPWRWADSPARRAPVATSTLADGVGVELHIEVAQPPAADDNGHAAVVSYVLSLPALEELQSRDAAHRHVRENGVWIWRQRPDAAGLLKSAADDLAKKAAEAQERSTRHERFRAGSFEGTGRWQAPAFDPDDPPYVFGEHDTAFRSRRKALQDFREHNALQVARELAESDPAFRRFPERWIARAMIRSRDDCLAAGVKLEEPGSRQRIEAGALALLERHYQP